MVELNVVLQHATVVLWLLTVTSLFLVCHVIADSAAPGECDITHTVSYV